MIPKKYQGIDRKSILKLRGVKNEIEATQAVDFFDEIELSSDGVLDHVSVVLLSNSECPLTCTMCDLWKNTLDSPTPPRSNYNQIRLAQIQLPKSSRIKLYNSGNFFDRRAVPQEELKDIAELLSDYSEVIVENHPKIRVESAPEFSELLDGKLEIAMGLETVHPEVFKFLNKGMEIEDFRKASVFLKNENIAVRAFIITGLPFLSPSENIEWTLRTIDYAFSSGASVCSIIPLRSSSGYMKLLENDGRIQKPKIESLEGILDKAQASYKGRVFLDLWDLEGPEDILNRLEKKNQNQSNI